jgi:hypothetical protein
VSHTYNPRYSGGRDQEDHGSKSTQANSLQDLISKTPSHKRAGGVAQDVGPEFKPQYCKKKKKLKKEKNVRKRKIKEIKLSDYKKKKHK